MPRLFNTAGPCRPEDHYMLPPEDRLPGVRSLIAEKAYFVIHAPRQTGKTTCFRTLAASLNTESEFAAVHASCEAGQTLDGNVESAVSAVLRSIARQAEVLPEAVRPMPVERFDSVPANSRLTAFLTRWCERSTRPIVLFLDEVDALIGGALIAVLRQLREGYPDRAERFPHSLALIGLRDVRDYRLRTNPEVENLGTSSPFNIKVESITLRDFTADEVAELYAQHTAETGQAWSAATASRAFELTRGQPWLVNALARQVVTVEVPERDSRIEVDHVDQAKEALILRRDTHLDSLTERLRESRVRRVIEPLLAGGFPDEEIPEDDLRFVEDLGLIAVDAGGLSVANPIYREVIPRALTAVTERYLPVDPRSYVAADGRLLLGPLIDDFTAFWSQHAESFLGRQPYSEAAAQLIFMAYLQRVVNGGGTIDREYTVGHGRIDLCVRWPLADGSRERFALELKVWRDSSRADPAVRGLEQLAGYLDRLGLEEGTLLIFDDRSQAPPPPERTSREETVHRGKRIVIVRL